MGGSVPIIMPSLPLSFASLKIEMREREREGDGFNEKVLQKIAMRDFMMLHKEEINA